MDRLRELYSVASTFARDTHSGDIERLCGRTELTDSVETFLEEYVYTVIASGFRGRVAAEYTRKILACLDIASGTIRCPLTSVFKNARKCSAIETVFRRFAGSGGLLNYRAAMLTWKTPPDLTELPMIGATTCWQLGRNIGLYSSAKPDVHMKRLFLRLFKNDDSAFIRSTFDEFAGVVHEPPGVVDFILWVYLSHNGVKRDCCYGGYALR